ncbi:uncharacterized protein LOC122497654 [Leptopilina heterotoma]|uniref:uncharacterized protein LOC122497654 n=1 Tax=Leptopilina heterotoma TaxID=63436 RepID=UPI001CA95AF7|nr:uncharacterized protein LOC122497654 [Leptopilina heterotoma]
MRIYLLVCLTILIVENSTAIGDENLFKVENNVAGKSAMDQKLKNFIEGLKEMMKNGNKTLGVPRLDPFQSKPLDMAMNADDFMGKFFTSSVSVEGLSNFIVNRATLKIVGLKMNISLEWPKIEGKILNYTISDGRLMNFVNFFGHGSAKFLIQDIKFSIEMSVAVNTTTKFLFIKEVQTSISIGDGKKNDNIEFYTEGLYNDLELSQLFSGVISELAPAAFDTYYNQIISTLNKLITDAGNKFLDKKTMKDLLTLVS